MFREFNTLELTFCVEFIITLLREMLKSSTLSITLFLLMCVFGMGGWSVCHCMESLSRPDLGDNVCEGGTRHSRPDLGDNVCEGGTHPSRPDLGDNVCEGGTHPSRPDLGDNVCEGGRTFAIQI